MNTDRQQELVLRKSGPVARVEEYTFEPIRGYPMLQWTGKRPFTSTRFYPAQHKETHGPEVDGWRNKIYWGDNLQVMSHLLKRYHGQVQLIYIDPPFDSKADYTRTITVRGKSAASDKTAFEEKQYADIWTNDEYLQFMYERLMILWELLADDGCIFVHCDYRKVHHLRCILDEIFGPNQFQNEIVWSYIIGASGNGRFGRKHQTLLFYSKGSKWIFNREAIGIPYNPETIARAKRGEARYNVSAEDLEERGKNPGDVWTDITPIQGNSLERQGYPTQKPESLLERVLLAASNEGGLVFDCFMGSGTTLAVAMKLGRRYIGADINLGAVQLTTKRLLSTAVCLEGTLFSVKGDGKSPGAYAGFEVYNVNHYDVFRNPVQAKEILLQALEVNPLQAGSLFDGEKDGRMVKIMPVNRIATRQDLNELINGFDYRAFDRRQAEAPNKPVEKITLVCMGHEPDLAAHLQQEMQPYKLDMEVVDILRDKQDLQFKRDSEAVIVIREGYLVVDAFYPMNLLGKLSLQKQYVEDWRELVDSVMIDWNYDGAVLQPAVADIPEDNELVVGRYLVPADAGTICRWPCVISR